MCLINAYISNIDDEEDEGEEIGEKEGQYFVDQATGQYYFQTSDGETMTVVSAPGIEEQGVYEKINILFLNFINTALFFFILKWISISILAVTKASPTKSADGASNQVMMSTGASSDQYQTVTIVPSDGDTGEVRL